MVLGTGTTVNAKNREGMIIRHRQFGLKESMVVKYPNGNKASFMGQNVNKVTPV